MTQSHNYLAIDLGAESGRTIVGTITDGKLSLTETHRFSNTPVRRTDGLHWDVEQLWKDILSGISISAQKFPLTSLGLDTWGVDFALLDKNNNLLDAPFHYRDERTDGMLEEAFSRIPREQIFSQTGVQFMQINTLYQLFSMSIQKSPLLEAADKFLSIPDLFNFWLSGQISSEFTLATTTQCYDPRQRDWAYPVLKALDIPVHIFTPVIQPGTNLGTLRTELATQTGAGTIPVIAPACHDTGSAVVAIPAENQDFAWISSGTWSIMGCETNEPAMNERALANNFTNEGGVFNTWRLSKNIMALWLVQECRRAWKNQGQDLSYDDLTRIASEARPFLAVVDSDSSTFLHPGDMPERICKFCADTNQAVPETKGEIIRVALESIALKYRFVLERLENITGKHFNPIHIIGGGTKNHLLSQFSADCTGRTVITGPIEATAIGNVLMQSISLGHLHTLAEARNVVRASFTPITYQPNPNERWDISYEILKRVTK